MSYQTIVAAFDTAAHAQAAVEALKAGGFHADDISMFDKNRVGLREPGLWQRMFGGGLAQHEADVYTQSLERGGMGCLGAGAGQRSRARNGYFGHSSSD